MACLFLWVRLVFIKRLWQQTFIIEIRRNAVFQDSSQVCLSLTCYSYIEISLSNNFHQEGCKRTSTDIGTLSWTWIRPRGSFKLDQTILHQASQQHTTLHLITQPWMCVSGFPGVEVSSTLAGKYKYIVSERDSVMYLSTFSFQFGSINSEDEWVSGWEKSPSDTRELTCQCPLLTRSSLACCYESTDISTFTLTEICYKRHPRAPFHLACLTMFICCHWDREQMWWIN